VAQFRERYMTIMTMMMMMMMKSHKACYHPVQNHLSFSWLSQNVKLKIYRTKILPVFFCGFETRSLIEGGT